MARLSFAHPSRQRLQAWLDATDEASGITEHVEQCDRCAARIEELADQVGDQEASAITPLGEALKIAYEPPADINDRVMEKIAQRRLADREMNLLLGLFSIPKDAVELLLPPDMNDNSSRERDDREE